MPFKRFLFYLFLLAVGIWLFVYTLHAANLHQIAHFLIEIFSWKFVLILLFAFIAVIYISAIRCFIVLNHQRQKPIFKHILAAEFVGFAFSYLTPVTFFGGEPFRYVILKEGNHIESSYAISSIIIEKMILFLMAIITFLIGVVFFFIYVPLNFGTQLGILIFLLVGMIAALVFYYKVKKIIKERGFFLWLLDKLYLSKLKNVKKYESEIEAIEKQVENFYCTDSRARTKVFLISVLETIISIIFIWAMIYFLIGPMAMGKVLVVNDAIGISGFIPLPAALGASEVSQAYVFQNVGLTNSQGIAFSLLLRTIFLVFSFIGVIIFVIYQINMIKSKIGRLFHHGRQKNI